MYSLIPSVRCGESDGRLGKGGWCDKVLRCCAVLRDGVRGERDDASIEGGGRGKNETTTSRNEHIKTGVRQSINLLETDDSGRPPSMHFVVISRGVV